MYVHTCSLYSHTACTYILAYIVPYVLFHTHYILETVNGRGFADIAGVIATNFTVLCPIGGEGGHLITWIPIQYQFREEGTLFR